MRQYRLKKVVRRKERKESFCIRSSPPGRVEGWGGGPGGPSQQEVVVHIEKTEGHDHSVVLTTYWVKFCRDASPSSPVTFVQPLAHRRGPLGLLLSL